MGLPEVTFELKQAVQKVAVRYRSGIVAVILRDAAENGLHTIYRAEDIPAKLGVENKAYLQRALIGHINTPSAVYAMVLPVESQIKDGFAALSNVDYDYLAGPPDISAEDATALGKLVTAARKLRYIGKVVLPNTAADDAGIVNFTAVDIKISKETTCTAAQYCSRIAGVLAGTPAKCSATYAILPEVLDVEAVADGDAAIDKGELILINDGRHVRLGRAVTSKTTLKPGEPPLLKKIKLVAAMDLIRFYAIGAVQDQYVGQSPNTYDDRCALLVGFREFMAGLEKEKVLETGTGGAEFDVDAIRNWLLERAEADGDQAEAERIRQLSNEELLQEDTGAHVFIALKGNLLDAMEDFHLTLDLSSMTVTV